MKIGALACYIMAIIFYAIAFILVLMKENGAKLISGFNGLPKAEQDTYDKVRIVNDCRNDFQVWATLMLAGGVLSMTLTDYVAIPAFVIWLVLFFKNVKLDVRKAYEKYKL